MVVSSATSRLANGPRPVDVVIAGLETRARGLVDGVPEADVEGALEHRDPFVARVGVRWQHERFRCANPDGEETFILARSAAGNISQAFSPDFYLPDQDLYVELTTMLPNQIRHKNRKIKRLRELYPEINIKLFKRGDIRSLMIKFGIDDPDMLHNEL